MSLPTHFTEAQLKFLQELNSEANGHSITFHAWPGDAYNVLVCTIDSGPKFEIEVHSIEEASAAIQRLRELTGRIPTHSIPERGSPERERHLRLCAQQALNCIYTWTMPADFGLNMGIPTQTSDPEHERTWRPVGTSTDEILQSIIEWEPRPDFDAGEDYPEDVRQYARELWEDTGAFIRNHANVDPFDVMDRAAHSLVTIIHLYGFNGVQRGIVNEVWEALSRLDHDLYVMAGDDPAEAWRHSARKLGMDVED